MGMVIEHNTDCMFTKRQLGITKKEKDKSMEKISSGYRINRAADDAAGLSISEKMRGQIRGLKRGAENTQDGISLAQTADGYLEQGTEMIQRIRELGVQAANDINTYEDRMHINEEVQQLKREMDRIFSQAEFNQKKIFVSGNETLPVSDVQSLVAVAVEVNDKFPPGATLDTASSETKHMSSTYTDNMQDPPVTYKAASRIDFSGIDFEDKSLLDNTGFYCTCCTCSACYCISFDSSINTVENPGTGTEHHTFKVGIADCETPEDIVKAIIKTVGNNPNNHYTNFVVDPDDATGSTLLLYDNRPNMVAEGNYGIMKPGIIKEEFKMVTEPGEMVGKKGYSKEWLQVGANDDEGFYIYKRGMTTSDLGITGTNTLSFEAASDTIRDADRALDIISTERSRWGAYQNRMEYTYDYDKIAEENTQDAESRIRDTDMAEEMTRLSKQNILEQAGISVLSNANRSEELVISLLQ